MKKFLFISTCMIGLFACTPHMANAQIPTKTTMKDTATNAAETYLNGTFNGKATDVTAQIVLTKVTGTPAGFCIPQGSLDGTNYVNISTDTLTVTNTTTQTKAWQLGTAKYDHYRLWYHHTGTQVTGEKGYLLYR